MIKNQMQEEFIFKIQTVLTKNKTQRTYPENVCHLEIICRIGNMKSILIKIQITN